MFSAIRTISLTRNRGIIFVTMGTVHHVILSCSTVHNTGHVPEGSLLSDERPGAVASAFRASPGLGPVTHLCVVRVHSEHLGIHHKGTKSQRKLECSAFVSL